MHIVMIANDTNFAWNLRREVLEQFVSMGHSVVLVAHILEFKDNFEKIGVKVIDVNNDRHGKNPFFDIKLFLKYKTILKSEKPDIVFTNNIKPNVYAGLACRMLNIKYVVNVTGLGTPVENPGKLQKLTVFLYKLGIAKVSTIFFQNKENQEFFVSHEMIPDNAKVVLLPGSGVNVESHPLLPWPEGPVHFLFAARIFKEKGIDYFLSAAEKFASENIIFDVCGPCDDPKYQEILKNNKFVVYHGLQMDLLPFYSKCSCLVNPSYYPEGMNNVILEAAACGRPVITSDRAGCREVAEDGVTGFVVPVKDGQAVIDAVGKFLAMTADEHKKMGLAGRAKIEKEFDRQFVVKYYLEEIA
jgi:galacturonosyltransferase